jgi:hypothetical protein
VTGALVLLLVCAFAAVAHGEPLQHEHAHMEMRSSTNLADPMSREGSGTAWMPDSSPIFAKMWMSGNDMFMVHGVANLRYIQAGSLRGDRRLDGPNWIMGMYTHPLDRDSQFGARLMMSLDPLTEGGHGYPLLFQTGETWKGLPLHDVQHPHDLFDEISTTYSRRLGKDASGYLYLAWPGEPALGPPTFMHRIIAYDDLDAPIGHHWQDATHITFGVATLGLELGQRLKLEASGFNGREPDENRYDLDAFRLDSMSGRLSWNPDRNNALQVSSGFVHNPEGDGIDVHRITASWLYNHSLGPDCNFTTSLVWGQNDSAGEGPSNSYLFEADYQNGRDNVFFRTETVQKSGHELVLPPAFEGQKFAVGHYTLGYVRDLTHGRGLDLGVGAALTLDTKPGSLDPFYGRGTPLGFQLFFRLRPSRMGASPPPAEHGDGSLRVQVIPGKGLTQDITVVVLDGAGRPVQGATVSLELRMSTMDMGTMHLTPPLTDASGRTSASVTFSMAGPWTATVLVSAPGHGEQTRVVPVDVAR